MSTQPRSVRKFEKQWSNPNPNIFMTVATFQQAGYHVVNKYNIQSIKSYKEICQIFKWCDNNFNRKHWLFTGDYFIFTHEHDSIMFRLTWL